MDRSAFVCRYHFEYSTRETYGGGFDWPETAPLSELKLSDIS